MRSQVHNALDRALPLGLDNEQISARTNHVHLARDPTTAAARLKQLSATIRTLQQQVRRLKLQTILEPGMVELHDGNSTPEMLEAIPKAFEDAKEVLSTEGPEMVEMWQLMLDNLKNLEKRKGNRRGVRFHPDILKFALPLLAKTSHSTCNQIREVFGLPSLRCMLAMQQKTFGSQREEDHIRGGPIEENLLFISAHLLEGQ